MSMSAYLSVCLTVFLPVRSQKSKTTWPNFAKFCACCLWPWQRPEDRWLAAVGFSFSLAVAISPTGRRYCLQPRVWSAVAGWMRKII